MKTVFRMSSLVLVAVIVLCASRLWAENKEKKPAPRTRIGVLNLTFVIKHYDKYKHYLEEIKEIVGPFQERDKKLRAQIEKLKAQAENSSVVPAKGEEGDEKSRKKELEKKAKEIQRELEDNSAEVKLKVGKRSDEAMKTLFQDVQEAVARYASDHGLDLVMHYNDAITEADYLSAKNIARKLNLGGLTPLYYGSGIDITTDIVTDLNQRNPG
jgi:Skp family chaperone for outer membrane proteins